MRILRLSTIDSTMLEARRQAEQGETGPLWIVSAEQTAGKGRLGRSWVSKVGNFYGTYFFTSAAPATTLPQLGFVVALAVHQAACRFVAPNRLALKWPNDVLLDGAKFCGILCENLGDGKVALGMGINIAHAPDGLPYKVARLTEAAVEPVFQVLQPSLSKNLAIWDEGRGFAAISRAWLERCPHVGSAVTVDGEQGNFLGLAADGALLLKLPSGKTKPIYAGDVRLEYQQQ